MQELTESQARTKLQELRAENKISVLSIGNHGLIFMSIYGHHLKSYDSNIEALKHYLKFTKPLNQN